MVFEEAMCTGFAEEMRTWSVLSALAVLMVSHFSRACCGSNVMASDFPALLRRPHDADLGGDLRHNRIKRSQGGFETKHAVDPSGPGGG
jgi:hypothetical protein